MQMTALAPHCGVEIRGVQLAEATGDAALLDEIRTAVWEHGVALLRDQDFGPQEHIAFARAWGGIDINNYFPLTDAFPEIAVVGKRADQTTNIGGGWHTDHSYDQIPAMGSILVARELPPTGGDTLFAHMGAAYDALSDDLKTEIEKLEAFHSADHVYSPDGYYAQTDMAESLRGQEMTTGARHPVAIRHPQTGRKLLYVSPRFTIAVDGMMIDVPVAERAKALLRRHAAIRARDAKSGDSSSSSSASSMSADLLSARLARSMSLPLSFNSSILAAKAIICQLRPQGCQQRRGEESENPKR